MQIGNSVLPPIKVRLFTPLERLQNACKTAVSSHRRMRTRAKTHARTHTSARRQATFCLPAFAAGRSFAALQEIAADPSTPQDEVACDPAKASDTLMDNTSSAGWPTAGSVAIGTADTVTIDRLLT